MKKLVIYLVVMIIAMFVLSACEPSTDNTPVITQWETLKVPLNNTIEVDVEEYSFYYEINGVLYKIYIDDSWNEYKQVDENDIRKLEVKFDYRFVDGVFEYNDVNIDVISESKEEYTFNIDVSLLDPISSYFKEVDDGITNTWYFKYTYDGDGITYDIQMTGNNANQIIDDNQEWDELQFTCDVVTYFDESTSLEDCSSGTPVDNLD